MSIELFINACKKNNRPTSLRSVFPGRGSEITRIRAAVRKDIAADGDGSPVVHDRNTGLYSVRDMIDPADYGLVS